MKPEQIKAIASAANAHGLAILERWLPGGKREGKNYVVINPHRDDRQAGSLAIDIETGKGGDFATDERFGDFVAVVAFAQKCDMSVAAADLASFIGFRDAGSRSNAEPAKTADTWVATLPVPESAPSPPVAHPTRGKPSVIYPYCDAAGRVLFYIWRFEKTATHPKKEFTQLTLFAGPGGKLEWRWKASPTPRPLYGLDQLAALPDALVHIHEGEKACEAGRKLLPDFAHVAWPGGAGAVSKVDFSPLAGRRVQLWPDFDEPGIKAMQNAAIHIKKAGAAATLFVDLHAFVKNTVDASGKIIPRIANLPDGWDAADALAEGWTQETAGAALVIEGLGELEARLAENELPLNAAKNQAESEKTGPYVLDEDGLYHVETDKEGKIRQTRICGPLKIPALARDADGASWSPVCEFRDRDRQQRRQVIPYKLFVGDGTDGIKQLADYGLEIASGRSSNDRLKSYIVGQYPSRRALIVDKCGWHGAAYMLPEGAIGETDETLIYQGNRRANSLFTTRGQLGDWAAGVARMGEGNPRLMFVLALAFSGPLLKLTGSPNMAFHLVGDSSIGKSAALVAAGSVWGNPENYVHSWRQTSNALEYTAAMHNDALLLLDELKEVDPKELAAVTYMLTNAKGKERAHHAGGLREATTWRIPMLSSGEIGLADHLASVGHKRHAGQEVRFVEINAAAGSGHGMWSELHGHPAGKEFTDYLKKASGRYYGTAGRAYVATLVKRHDGILSRWNHHRAAFAREHTPAKAGGQVLRVMSAFSLVAFAGELAREFGIVEWQEGAATAAAAELFKEWARERPSLGNAEDMQIIQHVRSVLERSWQARFVDWHRVTEKDGEGDLSRMAAVHDALGFRKRETPFKPEEPTFLFYVTRERFAEEFATKAGFKTKRVAAVLKARGVLQCDDDGTTYRETLPNGDPRSYCIIGSKLWGIEA
jgi:putative DNA primase/helicase